MKLGSTINLDVYCFAAQGMIQGKKASAITLPAGHVKPYYIGHVPSDKLPKGAASGHYLQGLKHDNQLFICCIDLYDLRFLLAC